MKKNGKRKTRSILSLLLLPVAAAAAPTLPTSVTSLDDLTQLVCGLPKTASKSDLASSLRQAGADNVIASLSQNTLTVDSFADDLVYFRDADLGIPAKYNVQIPGAWTLPSSEGSPNCHFVSTASMTAVSLQEMRFGDLDFIGLNHFYNLPPYELPSAVQALTSRLKRARPDAVIIEGRPYGQRIDCTSMMNAVFQPDNQINDETVVSIKYGFLNKVKVIPGDRQQITAQDAAVFFGGDESKARQAQKEMQFIDILHSYYTHLQNSDPDPLGAAIEDEVHMGDGTTPARFNESEFKAYYRQLNHRTLPTNSRLIYQDFTPSAFSQAPRGTNRLSDLQDYFRNQALLQAIQITMQDSQRTALVVGTGHLEEIGLTLETVLGAPVNVDFKSRCR